MYFSFKMLSVEIHPLTLSTRDIWGNRLMDPIKKYGRFPSWNKDGIRDAFYSLYLINPISSPVIPM
jgi:hypothetical protein